MMLASSSFTIRPVQRDEWTQVMEVYRQCEDFLTLGPDPRASMEMIEKDMQISREAGGIFCGIFDDDQNMIGVVDFIPNNFEGNPAHAFVELLMIAMPARRKGLGREVMQTVEDEILKNSNITDILSAVQVNNPNAIQFWKNIGYEIVSEPIPCSDGTTVYKLRKIIHKENSMIARIWHGVTPASKADEYVEYVNKTGIRDYQAIEGNLGIHFLRRIEGNEAHFLTVTFWDSVESIKKFTGEEYEKARYYPEDAEYLLELEEKVTYYEVMFSASSMEP